jgi:hypothetical protein
MQAVLHGMPPILGGLSCGNSSDCTFQSKINSGGTASSTP